MGPFPHHAPKSANTADNPAGPHGIEILDIELWQQGDITYVLTAEAASFAARFVQDHGPCAPSMGWRVVDAQHAFERAVQLGAKPYEGGGKVLDVPAIYGIGGSLIYFVDQYHDTSPYNDEYEWLAPSKPRGVGFFYLDHLTHNVHKGNMDTLFRFYGDLFIFKFIRFFDIAGASDDIYDSTDAIAANGLTFMPGPPDAYYNLSKDRVAGHDEPIDRMKRHGILIDGEGVVDGGETKILLQIFSKTVIGPIFFEFIQRKGDDGFGEGNFKALFESIEQEQINNGELAAE